MNAEDDWGRTPLACALRGGDPSSIIRHNAAEAPRRQRNTQVRERSVWEQAERAETEAKLRLLLKAGADPNKGKDAAWTPLALAAFCWDLKTIGAATEGDGEDARAPSLEGAGRRFFATHDPAVLVKLLVEAGAVRRYGDGPDALDVAARRKDDRRAAVMAEVKKAKLEEGKKSAF